MQDATGVSAVQMLNSKKQLQFIMIMSIIIIIVVRHLHYLRNFSATFHHN